MRTLQPLNKWGTFVGNVPINRRVGLAAMAFAAVFPVGLSAVGNAPGAVVAAVAGFPLVLLGAIAWRGNKGLRSATVQNKRVGRQKRAVVFAFFALLASVLVSDWPREVAIQGSVTLNPNNLHRAALLAQQQTKEEWGWIEFGAVPKVEDGYTVGCSGTAHWLEERGVINGYHVGLIRSGWARVNNFGDVFIYMKQLGRDGHNHERLIYQERGPGH